VAAMGCCGTVADHVGMAHRLSEYEDVRGDGSPHLWKAVDDRF